MNIKTDEEYRKIFHKKLNYYMKEKGKTQSDLIRDLGFSSSTISNWCTGLKLPRMGKIQMLADYFGINKSDLIEEKSDSSEPELNILKYYNKLNLVGKEEAEKRIEELTHIDKYTNTVELLNAAHEIPGASKEDKKHDDDIMDDENF